MTENSLPVVSNSWPSLGLKSEILKKISEAGFEKPTPIQEKAIPLALEGKDLMASAQTGTGKTAAFVLPMTQKLLGREGTYGLVLAPSREIALQIQTVFEKLAHPLGVRSIVLIGGVNMRHDEVAINTYPQIIVATPGRLCDHLERGNIWLSYLEYVVLDEADRMLEMGFADQLNKILDETPKNRQTLLFSATFSAPVEKLARHILVDPVRVQIGKAVEAAKTVDQRFIFTNEEAKLRVLLELIQKEQGSIFIFTRSKEGATKLWRSLRSRGFYDATHLHSDLRQVDREKSLEDFKKGLYRVMIATDVIGRGIHVDGVAHVVNFDLPRDAEDYVHRIGRTGRADQVGKATSLITPRDTVTLKKIERLIGKPIRPDSPGESVAPSHQPKDKKPDGQHKKKPIVLTKRPEASLPKPVITPVKKDSNGT